MLWTLQRIIEEAVKRLSDQLITYVPPLLAAVVILAGAWIVALVVRWAFHRAFKGIELDRWLKRTGVSTVIDPTGRMCGAHVMGQIVYWTILGVGLLTALNAFNTQLTTRIVEGAVLLFPKLASAVLIVLAGIWLAQYLSRGTLVWAVNEEIPSPRRLATAVRLMVIFIAIVVASEYLDFAQNVFLAAFILLGGAAALAGGLALGLGGRDAIAQYLRDRASPQTEERHERSLWTHL